MAKGSFTKTVGNRSGIANEYIKVWWESTPDPANNRSKVRVYAKMYRPWYLAVDFNQDIILWINGEKFTGSRYGWRGSGWTKAYIDETIWVPHKADGTKSIKIRLKTEVRAWLRSWVGWVDTGNVTCKLDNLARKSTFTLNKSSASIGDTIKVNLARSSSKVRHAITIKVGDHTDYILGKSKDNGETSSYNYTLSSDLLQYMTGQTATAKVTLYTYNGNTSLGTNSSTFTLKIRSDTDKPSIPNNGGITIEPIPISPNTSTDCYIQGKSKAKITITPTLALGSAGAIKSYNVSINGIAINSNKNVITTDILNKSGENTITATVTDGRGMKSDKATVKFTVLPYSIPMISDFSVSRCLEDGTLDRNGGYGKVSFNYNFSSCNNTNSVTITLKEKNSVNSETYTEKKTWTISATDGVNGNISEKLDGEYSVNDSFDFELSIVDFYNGTSTYYEDIGTEELLIDLAPNSVGVGKVVERENALEVGWETWFEEPVHATVQTYTSDIRKKLLVGDSLLPLLKIWDELSIVLFKYRDADDKKLLGLVAQDVISIFNAHELDWRDYGLVYEDPATGYYSINYEFINQLSMLKVKTLQSQICELASRITKLEK